MSSIATIVNLIIDYVPLLVKQSKPKEQLTSIDLGMPHPYSLDWFVKLVFAHTFESLGLRLLEIGFVSPLEYKVEVDVLLSIGDHCLQRLVVAHLGREGDATFNFWRNIDSQSCFNRA